MQPSLPDALFLDVDGVLIDSVGIKGDVFVEVFADIPNSAKRVRNFHRTHGGLTRDIKIRRLLEILTNMTPSDADVSARVNHFAELVVDLVTQAPEIDGTHEFLQVWSERCPLYAVSATPAAELKRIMAARLLSPFFQEVVGWPPAKSELMIQTIKSEGFEASRCILVGDSDEDYRAAIRASVRFISFGASWPDAQAVDAPHIAGWSGFDEIVPEVLTWSAP